MSDNLGNCPAQSVITLANLALGQRDINLMLLKFLTQYSDMEISTLTHLSRAIGCIWNLPFSSVTMFLGTFLSTNKPENLACFTVPTGNCPLYQYQLIGAGHDQSKTIWALYICMTGV